MTHSKTHLIHVWHILALFSYFTTVSAATISDDWNRGLAAFQQNNFEEALTRFESARDAGQGGPAVHYNIGVCQYKLGNYADAGKTFSFIANQFADMRGLAEYNLGLVALKQNRRDSAREHFRESYRLSSGERTLRLLASKILRQLQPVDARIPRWTGLIGFRAGYDDNIRLRDDLGLAPGEVADSPSAEILGSLRGPNKEQGGIHLDAAVYVLEYFDIDSFDQNALRVGAVYDWREGEWGSNVGIFAGYATLGGDGYDQTSSLHARLIRRLNGSTSISASYRYDDVNSVGSLFHGIDGSRQRFDVQYRSLTSDRNLTLTYQVESNDRTDPGVSPFRNTVRIDYRFRPWSDWEFGLGAGFRNSNYDDLLPERTEDLKTFKITVAREIASGWRLLGQYQYSDNDSSDSLFSYDRNRITLGFLRLFH